MCDLTTNPVYRAEPHDSMAPDIVGYGTCGVGEGSLV